MDDLVKRLEEATEGSRELDQDIYHALGLCSKLPDGTCIDFTAPFYTEYIDAALTLVSDGWWLVSCGEQRTQLVYADDKHEPTGMFYASIQHVRGGRLKTASARSLALALCIAVLRAKES